MVAWQSTIQNYIIITTPMPNPNKKKRRYHHRYTRNAMSKVDGINSNFKTGEWPSQLNILMYNRLAWIGSCYNVCYATVTIVFDLISVRIYMSLVFDWIWCNLHDRKPMLSNHTIPFKIKKNLQAKLHFDFFLWAWASFFSFILFRSYITTKHRVSQMLITITSTFGRFILYMAYLWSFWVRVFIKYNFIRQLHYH